MEEPPHRSTPGGDGLDADRAAAGGARRRLARFGGILVAAIVIALIALIVFLHLSGTIGPGIH